MLITFNIYFDNQSFKSETGYETQVYMLLRKKLMFKKQSELTVTMEQLPAGLVKPEPY